MEQVGLFGELDGVREDGRQDLSSVRGPGMVLEMVAQMLMVKGTRGQLALDVKVVFLIVAVVGEGRRVGKDGIDALPGRGAAEL